MSADISEPPPVGRPSGARRRGRVLVVALASALAASTFVGPAAHAQPDEEAAQQAAREIDAAQERANEAATAWALAESELERLEGEAQQLQQEEAALQAQVDHLRTTVEQAAVTRFMTSGSAGIPLLTGYQQPLDRLSAAELGRVVTGTADDAFDQFDLAQRDLDRKSDELAAKQSEVAQQRVTFEQANADAILQVEHLKEVEEERLADEQVRLALEAQRREEQRRLAEQQAAEAAQRAAEEAQRAADQQRASEAQRAADASASQAAAQAAASTPASNDVAAPPAAIAADSGSDDDGSDTPVADGPATAPANPGMICPVQGPTAYGDTWGASRSGGRRHEGVDMISPKGTTLVAVADGDARFWTNGQGALGVSLTADNGTRYYYGHLSSYEGSPGRVTQGQVIGYVGSTGATTVNHLHFEVHPGGGSPVNPTPYVRNAGC